MEKSSSLGRKGRVTMGGAKVGGKPSLLLKITQFLLVNFWFDFKLVDLYQKTTLTVRKELSDNDLS